LHQHHTPNTLQRISMAAAATMSLPMASSLRRPAFSAVRPQPQRMTVHKVTRCGAFRPQRQPQQGAAAPARPAAQQLEPAARSDGSKASSTTSDAELKADGLLMLAAAMTPLLLDVEPAAAGNPLLTGKTVSLVHPVIMFGLLGVSIYTGILGWNYRTARLIPAEVKGLKSQLPSDEEAKAASPLQSQIKELEGKRKDLLKGDPRAKHYLWSSLLLGLGGTFSIVGPLNTYLRTGKLFPGPHLYAGAAIVVFWSIAAAMVPLMSRNNDTARYVHIGANALTVALFVWQVPTGIEIVLKVFQFAPWP
jgi:hypothetical protein